MDHPISKTLALLIAAIVLSSGFIAITDSSCASDAESFAGFEGDLSQDDADRLFGSNDRSVFAHAAMDAIGLDPSFDVASDVSISDVSVDMARAVSVDGDVRRQIVADYMEMRIGFTARTTSAGEVIPYGCAGMLDLLKHLNGNRASPGDEVVVSAEVVLARASDVTERFERNASGGFVRVAMERNGIGQPGELKCIGIESNLVFRLGPETKNVLFTSECESVSKIEVKTEFDVDVMDVVPSTPAYVVSTGILDERKAKGSYVIDDQERAFEDVARMSSSDGMVEMGSPVMLDSLYHDGIIAFYGSDAEAALFTDPADATLMDDGAMRSYLSTIGDVDGGFGDATDLFKEVMGDTYEGLTPLKIGIIIGSFALLAGALVFAYFFVKRVLLKEK